VTRRRRHDAIGARQSRIKWRSGPDLDAVSFAGSSPVAPALSSHVRSRPRAAMVTCEESGCDPLRSSEPQPRLDELLEGSGQIRPLRLPRLPYGAEKIAACHLAERVVAEVVLEPGVPGRRLARVDLERNLARILWAVDAWRKPARGTCESKPGRSPTSSYLTKLRLIVYNYDS
jgi:hypothetical protein